MSVFYDSDPGRLEVYRPRADGLTSRSFCVSVLLHALVACLLLTVHFPKPQSTPRRRYRITEGSEEVQLRKVGYELFKR